MWNSRWPSWAPVPNKPRVSVDVKQHFSLIFYVNGSCFTTLTIIFVSDFLIVKGPDIAVTGALSI